MRAERLIGNQRRPVGGAATSGRQEACRELSREPRSRARCCWLGRHGRLGQGHHDRRLVRQDRAVPRRPAEGDRGRGHRGRREGEIRQRRQGRAAPGLAGRQLRLAGRQCHRLDPLGHRGRGQPRPVVDRGRRAVRLDGPGAGRPEGGHLSRGRRSLRRRQGRRRVLRQGRGRQAVQAARAAGRARQRQRHPALQVPRRRAQGGPEHHDRRPGPDRLESAEGARRHRERAPGPPGPGRHLRALERCAAGRSSRS